MCTRTSYSVIFAEIIWNYFSKKSWFLQILADRYRDALELKKASDTPEGFQAELSRVGPWACIFDAGVYEKVAGQVGRYSRTRKQKYSNWLRLFCDINQNQQANKKLSRPSTWCRLARICATRHPARQAGTSDKKAHVSWEKRLSSTSP